MSDNRESIELYFWYSPLSPGAQLTTHPTCFSGISSKLYSWGKGLLPMIGGSKGSRSSCWLYKGETQRGGDNYIFHHDRSCVFFPSQFLQRSLSSFVSKTRFLLVRIDVSYSKVCLRGKARCNLLITGWLVLLQTEFSFYVWPACPWG